MVGQNLNGSVWLVLAAAVLTLHRLVQVSAVTCYHGIGSQTQAANGSTISLREGEILVVHCTGNAQLYSDLTLRNCVAINGLSTVTKREDFTLNITWYCHAIGNTSMDIYGFSIAMKGNAEKLLELHIEVHDLEQYLADAKTTPSLCTTPSPPEHTTTSSTTSPMSATLTEMITTTVSLDPTTSDQLTANIGGSLLNTSDVEKDAIREHSLYGVVGVLGVIALVQFMVIWFLVMKLCYGRRREKDIEERTPNKEGTSEMQATKSSSQQSSNRDRGTVISNSGSMDMKPLTHKTNSCEF